MQKKILALALLAIVLPLPLLAQRSGANVTGHVFDPSGAPIPGVAITARQVETGAVNKTQSNEVGLYQFPFLPVGTYQFSFEKQGFKTYTQSGVTLEVAQNAVVDAHLQLGAITQSVNVTANASMLDTTTASDSWSISSQRVTAIPIRNQNTIIATWFAPGVTVTSGARNIRPFDTSGSQHENIAGGLSGGGGFGGRPGQPGGSGNLVLVNGVSVNGEAYAVHFNPIPDTVQQVHVQSTMYDAQYGWTSGGVINTITKGGTNTWHGHAYEYIQNTILNARTWQEAYSNIPRGAWHQNYFGGSVGGPVVKNKLFAFFAYEKLLQVQPDYNTTSVPTAAMKQGDFSNLYTGDPNNGGTLVTIYNPLTTSCSGGSCTRTAFTGNVIPTGMQNPVAQAVLSYIPDPTSFGSANPEGDPGTHLNNWITNSNRRKFIDDFPQYAGRLDYNASDTTHMSFQYGWNSLAETRGFNYSFIGQPYNLAETSGNVPFVRQNDFYALQLTHTFNPTTVLQLRTGLTRFLSISGSSISNGFDVSSLHFSPTFVSQSSAFFPQFSWSNYGGAGSRPAGITPSDPTFTNEAVLAKTMNKQNWKFGFQNMIVQNNVVSPGQSAGAFGFTNTYTTADPLHVSSATGNSIADFLLGYPASGYIQRLSDPKLTMHLWSVFAQDDIRLTHKLTVTAGIRWAYQGPLTDRFNALLRGFCDTCASPLYSPGFPLTGGVEFAGVGSNPRGIQNPKYGNIAPRLGFAYRLKDTTVVRGGFGIIYAQAWQNPGAAPGFSQNTYILQPEQTGIPATTLTNPFPDGVLSPAGSSYGLVTAVGGGVGFTDPNTNIPQTMQYSLSVQHQFRENWRLSASYIGSIGRRMPVNRQLNYLPLSAINQGADYLTATVDNPMAAIQTYAQNAPYLSQLSGTYLNASTIQQQHLLVPYPQFGINGVTEEYVPIGTMKYNALWADLNKRMSHGLDFDINFAWSKTMQKTQYLNNTDPSLSWFLSPWDSPEQIKFSGVWDLPFGRGREFLTNAGPVVDRVVKGWQVSGISRWQAGFPIPFPTGNVGPTGASVKTAHRSINHWFNTCTLLADNTTTGCSVDSTPAWQVLQPYQLEEWSPYLPNLRGPTSWQTDIAATKQTQIKERYKLTFRADFTNAFNHPDWAYNSVVNNANSGAFGQYAPASNQTNNPRVIMLSLQLTF